MSRRKNVMIEFAKVLDLIDQVQESLKSTDLRTVDKDRRQHIRTSREDLEVMKSIIESMLTRQSDSPVPGLNVVQARDPELTH